MGESAGPSTQAGLFFQNSIAALYLQRMLNPRLGEADRPVEVCVEAPEQVDDTVVQFADGHSEFIQAKLSIAPGSNDWKDMWKHFENQPLNTTGDRLILRLGKSTEVFEDLKEICDRAKAPESYDEWYWKRLRPSQDWDTAKLSGLQKRVHDVRGWLEKEDNQRENEALFALLKRVDITIASQKVVESVEAKQWLPACDGQEGLFSILRDICNDYGRDRKVIRPDSLRSELAKKGFDISLLKPPVIPPDLAAAEDTYRQRLVAAYGRLSFIGFERGDPFLGDMPLEKVFARLSLTVEKVVRETEDGREDGRPGLGAAGRKAGRGTRPGEEDRERVIPMQEPVSLATALSTNVLIVGEPGAGKSTLLKWLAVTFAQRRQREEDRLGPQADADRLPLLVELGRLPEEYLNPDRQQVPVWPDLLPAEIIRPIKEKLQVRCDDISPELFRSALDNGRCLLLCDGLDEVVAGKVRKQLADSLVAFGANSGNRIVIASRPAGLSEVESALFPQFQRCQIERLTWDEVKAFFRFCYGLDKRPTDEQQAAADDLFEQLKANPEALNLATTPLLATMLLRIWRREKTLPTRRVELYERCCKQLVENWVTGHEVALRGVLAGLDLEKRLRLLAPLAYAIHGLGPGTRAGKEQLLPEMARALQREKLCKAEADATWEAEQFLTGLGLRSGLLQDVGGGQYGFPHHTFQEYLAARYIADQEYPENLFMPHLHEAWWREVHLLTIGHLGSGKEGEGGAKISRLIRAILDVYPPPSRLLLPSRSPSRRLFDPGRYLPRVQSERRIAWMLGRELELAASAMAETEPAPIYRATQDLLDMRTGRLIWETVRDNARWGALCYSERVLLAALGDSDGGVREMAAESLGRLGRASPEVVQALLAALGDGASGVRETAAESLGQLGRASPEVVQALLAALSDGDLRVRAMAAKSLGGSVQASPEVVQALLLAALGDRDQYVRKKAAESLGQLVLASPEVVQALLTALSDGDSDVRWQAAYSLRRLVQASPEVVQALLAALGDGASGVRETAAESLGELGQAGPEVVQAMLIALRDRDEHVRYRAATILGGSVQAGPEVVQALLAALGDRDQYVRGQAARSLGRLVQTSPEVVQALLTALGDRDSDVRWQAAESLGALGQASPEVVQALLSALGDWDNDVRGQAAKSLGELGRASPEVVQALLSALGGRDEHVRWQVAKSLGELGRASPKVMQMVITALGDRNSNVRRQAAEGLGELGPTNPEVVQALLAAQVDRDLRVRAMAAKSLGKLGQASPEVVQALLAALGDRDLRVRAMAAKSLIELDQASPEVVQALLAALGDSDLRVRVMAAKSLVELDQASPEVVQALLAALGDGDEQVRWQAVDTLKSFRIEDGEMLSRVLAVLSCKMHDIDLWGRVRGEALNAARRLVEGRPLPGYRWVPIGERPA